MNLSAGAQCWPRVQVRELSIDRGLVGGPFGSSLGRKDYRPSGVPVIRGTNLAGTGSFSPEEFVYVSETKADELGRNLAIPDDLVFTQRGTLGQVGIVPERPFARYVISQSQMRLRCDTSKVDSRFLYFVFRSSLMVEQILSRAITTGVPHINLGILGDLELLLPPLAEQRGIAATLGVLDDKIESNQRSQIAALDLAASLVSHQIRGAASISQRHAMSVVMGSAFKGGAFSTPGTGRPLLRIRDLRTFSSQTWTTEKRPDETVIQPGDIVVGMDAEFRATLWQGAPSLLNQRVCAFLPRNGVSRAFVLAALSPQLAFYENAKSGTTVIHLNKADIERFRVPDLTVAQHAELLEQTEPLLDLVVNASVQSLRLRALRDTLSPEMLSGRIRVPEAGPAVNPYVLSDRLGADCTDNDAAPGGCPT